MTDFLGKIEDFFEWKPKAPLTAIDSALTLTPTTTVVSNTSPPTIISPPAVIKPVWPTQAQVWAGLYGHPGTVAWENEWLVSVPCPWTLLMDKTVLHSIQINKKCADSLKIVLNNVWEKVGKTQEAIEKLHYHLYSGSYNYRVIRGGSAPSMHSFGLAIDFDDQENLQHSQKHLFQGDSPLVVEFEAQGWTWGGRWSPASVDGMHFQLPRVH